MWCGDTTSLPPRWTVGCGGLASATPIAGDGRFVVKVGRRLPGVVLLGVALPAGQVLVAAVRVAMVQDRFHLERGRVEDGVGRDELDRRWRVAAREECTGVVLQDIRLAWLPDDLERAFEARVELATARVVSDHN